MTAKSISYNLAQNALDYLILAGEQAQKKKPRMTKHALATLSDGIELLLKVPLELRDWSLVFKDIDKATLPDYEAGDFQSVLFDQAVKRLKNICLIEIEDKHVTVLKELRDLRNRIRHFAVETPESVAMSLITKTFSFAIEFVTDHLTNLQELLEEELIELRALLGEFEEFIHERMTAIQPEIDSAYTVVDCPICLQPALIPDGTETKCLFCYYQDEGESAAQQWVLRFFGFQRHKHDLISPRIETCPECCQEACIDMSGHAIGDHRYVCLSCGQHGDYTYCSSCGLLEICDEEKGDMCSDCWERLLKRND